MIYKIKKGRIGLQLLLDLYTQSKISSVVQPALGLIITACETKLSSH